MKQNKCRRGKPLVRLHTRLVDSPPPCESAARQYRVGLIRFESGRVLVFQVGVLGCSSRMTGNLQVRFLEGWAPAMVPGYSTCGFLRFGRGCKPRRDGGVQKA